MASIRKLKFKGDRAIELRTKALRLVATTSRGPRVAFFGAPGGENLLYWNPGKHRRGEWDLLGGHRLWTSRPGADESEEAYLPDNNACAVETTRTAFTVTAPVDPASRLQRGFSVRATAPDRVVIDHFVRNAGDMLWSGGLWALTCTLPATGTVYSAPLGDGSSWDYATVVAFSTWGGHGQGRFDDPQFEVTSDQFVLRPSGMENKRMLKADPGILAMHDPKRGVLFAKHAAFDPAGHYPLGTNLALYVGPENFMVEMETMGAFVTLKPGETLRHTETWVLRPAGARPPGASSLKRLFK